MPQKKRRVKKTQIRKLSGPERKTLRRLREIEGSKKWPPQWRASSALVRANLSIMDKKSRHRIKNEARKHKMSPEKFMKKSLEIIRRIESEVADSAKGKRPVVTFINIPEGISSKASLLNYWLEKEGKLPTSLKKIEKSLSVREKLTLEEIRHEERFFIRGGLTQIGVAHPPMLLTAYHRRISEGIVDSILRGRPPSRRVISTVVHEVLETSEKIKEKGLHFTFTAKMVEEKPHLAFAVPKEEKRVVDKIMKNLEKIFPEYYSKGRKKKV